MSVKKMMQRLFCLSLLIRPHKLGGSESSSPLVLSDTSDPSSRTTVTTTSSISMILTSPSSRLIFALTSNSDCQPSKYTKHFLIFYLPFGSRRQNRWMLLSASPGSSSSLRQRQPLSFSTASTWTPQNG